ncbi:uncharacterized protein EHS24_008766 [Apiotrichum porosum]|uniref:DASH complex subunit DAD3 n=1 Tax=Apiotrichum porosum TaxID=105984 RepID=A0A427XR91_9TREE|nr:uncharacterized protein EHS24_008766 [Apiotrichum porosum]RSH81323.1 hypothetical protein EHS24_008766 [Apiotrichum porosum]
MSLATTNPYANHPQLSALEAEVLWEYAKLSDTISKIGTLARDTAETPNESLLASLRDLETKMKLVFTTGLLLPQFQTSVFLINQEHNLASEDAAQQAYDHDHHQEEGASGYTSYAHYDDSEGDSTIQY